MLFCRDHQYSFHFPFIMYPVANSFISFFSNTFFSPLNLLGSDNILDKFHMRIDVSTFILFYVIICCAFHTPYAWNTLYSKVMNKPLQVPWSPQCHDVAEKCSITFTVSRCNPSFASQNPLSFKKIFLKYLAFKNVLNISGTQNINKWSFSLNYISLPEKNLNCLICASPTRCDLLCCKLLLLREQITSARKMQEMPCFPSFWLFISHE